MKIFSNSSPDSYNRIPLIILRAAVGIIFITHGVARLYHDSISGFGEFLNSRGFMIGEFIAWAITIGEIAGGILLITGFLVRYAVIFHFVIVLTGIFLVHFPNGWFVVGHGQNGVEYSFLILCVLFYPYTRSSGEGSVQIKSDLNTG